ncbi:TPA: hypothetical protein QB598_002163 [Pasteurella multocida]|uniref:hypothetical protein n=1 Tax=Pasteurella multocida TaxID=747 RepID=UPI0029A44902|nr:hypothetical protein [Pasteurella multocida]HDR1832328.1 hypothetical protein [Pasteurella multocida]HEH9782797.1 hypothetical protein [Pasteurella multocida]
MCKCQKQNPDNAGFIKIKSVVVNPVVEKTFQQPRRIRQVCHGCHRLALLDASTHFCVSCRLKQHLAHKEQAKAFLKSLALPSVDNLDELAIATSQSTVLQELQGVLQSLTRHHERLYHFHLSSSACFPEVIQKGEQYIKALNQFINSLKKEAV